MNPVFCLNSIDKRETIQRKGDALGELMSYLLNADRLLTDIVIPQKSRIWKTLLKLSNAPSPGAAFPRTSQRDGDLLRP